MWKKTEYQMCKNRTATFAYDKVRQTAANNEK